MTGKALRQWLDAPGEARALVHEARGLLALQAALAGTVPAALGSAARVVSVRGGTLLIAADNGAVAGKLRQLAPTLLARVRALDRNINGIRVIVLATTTPSIRVRQKTPLSGQALQNLENLAEALPDSPLKAAVARMVARHGASRR
jgi:hypothetical protein